MAPPSKKKTNKLLQRIRKDPTEYLHTTSPDLKRNIEFVLAALHGSAALDDIVLYERILDKFFNFWPFASPCRHMRMVCNQVLDTGKPNFIRACLEKMEPHLSQRLHKEQYTDNDDEWDTLKDILLNRPQVFGFLPKSLQAKPLMIKAAIHHKLDDQELEMILQDTPVSVFIDDPFLIVQRLRRYQRLRQDPLIYWQRIPAEVWLHPAIVQQLVCSVRDIPRSMFPTNLCSDRTFFLDIFQSQRPRLAPLEANIPNLMAASLKADKGFVLESIRLDPFMLFHCAEELQSDLDIFLEATQAAVARRRLSERLVNDLGDRFDTFMKTILVTSLSLDFKAFLACCWKYSQYESMHHHPLRLLDCGLETSTALKKHIHSYVVETETTINRMAPTLHQVLSFVMERDMPPPSFFHSIPKDFLVRMMQKELLKGSWGKCAVHVRHVPSELWQDRHFVLCWIKGFGQLHSLIPIEFNADIELCLAYYKVCVPDHLRDCLAWISDSLVTDKSFLTQCALTDPIILNYCSDDIRLDGGFLFDFVSQLCETRSLRSFTNFLVTAEKGGWVVALERLKNEIRRKRVDWEAYHAFDERIRESQLFASFSPEHSTSILEAVKGFVGVVSNHRLGRLRSVTDICNSTLESSTKIQRD